MREAFGMRRPMLGELANPALTRPHARERNSGQHDAGADVGDSLAAKHDTPFTTSALRGCRRTWEPWRTESVCAMRVVLKERM